jgi:hypothetical protein
MRVLPALAIVIGVLMLAGCGKKATTVPDGAGSTAAGQGETGAAAGEGQVGEGRELPGASGAALVRFLGGGAAGVIALLAAAVFWTVAPFLLALWALWRQDI